MLSYFFDMDKQSQTTILAIKTKEGVVIASDMQISGYYIYGDTLKVIPLTKRIYVAFTGIVSDIQYLIKILRNEIELFNLRTGREIKVQEIANLVSLINYYGVRNFFPRIAGFILAGFDEKDFYIYDIGIDGFIEEKKDYIASGSGSIFVLPILDNNYNKDMSLKEAKELAIKALQVAAKRDLFSGIGYVVYTITKTKVEKETGKLDPYEVESVKEVIKIN